MPHTFLCSRRRAGLEFFVDAVLFVDTAGALQDDGEAAPRVEARPDGST